MARYRKHSKRRGKGRRHNPGLASLGSSLAFMVNRKKKRRKKARRANPRRRRRAHARRANPRRRRHVRMAFRHRANPRRARRRRNPYILGRYVGRRAFSRRRRIPLFSKRRRNPGFLSSLFAPIKEYGLGAASASIVDLFVADPLLANLAPTVRGPAKILAYPLLAALLGRFLKGPTTGKIASQIGVFGLAFGIKETIARLTGHPQAGLADLADSYAKRMAMAARQQRSMQNGYNGMRYLPSAGMRYLPSARGGMSYVPSAQMRGMSAVTGANPYAKR